jgi:hypothetical protein
MTKIILELLPGREEKGEILFSFSFPCMLQVPLVLLMTIVTWPQSLEIPFVSKWNTNLGMD